MPIDYDSEKTQAFLKSINFKSLFNDVNKKFPEANGKLTGIYFVPLFFKSATGKPDRMVLRADTKPKENWAKKDEVEKYLGSILESKLKP